MLPFRLDAQRILRSHAFRRLQYKTQVFVNHEGDYYRTRLTHTIEVAQVARQLAGSLRLNEDLSEAIALAHDMGHPPYGHAGEHVLNLLMAEHHGFEHNAQALRIVDLLERRYAGFRGLNLTQEVREGLWKGRSSPSGEVFGYQAEFAEVGHPLLEAQVSDWADEIAYDHHDLDDALKARLIRMEDLREVSLWREAEQLAAPQLEGADRDRDPRVRRQEIIRTLRRIQCEDLVSTSRVRLAEANLQSVANLREYRGQPLIALSPPLQERKRELQVFLRERVYRHPLVKRKIEKGERILSLLFKEFVQRPHQLPEEYQEWVEREGVERGVCDYVSGMTDRYAQRELLQLFGLREGS